MIQYLLLLCTFAISGVVAGQGFEGYYRFPTLSGETLVFTAEGDLWTVPLSGGLARRLTTHPGEETHPRVSPDGTTVAFSATYEGPTEVYTMPLLGGLPQRWTYEAESSIVSGWTPGGEVVYVTTHYATLPHLQSVRIDPATKQRTRIPLSQSSETSFDASGKTVYFVRPADHRNVTKRYTGGTARRIWKFTEGTSEAIELKTDHEGESHHPMWWNGRIYFITDRDGTMNLWSMTEAGGDLQQHTRHEGFDVRYATLSDQHIVYQRGADIWHYDIASGKDAIVPIRLASDLDQLREKWVEKPGSYITNVALHPEGKQLVITARGRVFVVPVDKGRRVRLSRKEGVRYRDAVFSSDGKSIIVLSDESGEFEYLRIPADGIGDHEALTENGTTLRFTGVPSPDGKWLAYNDLDQHLWLLDLEAGTQKKISTNNNGIGDVSWSPDSRWISFVQAAANTFAQIHLYEVAGGNLTELTTDRMNSFDPVWSPDGQWLYFISDRNFETLVGSPWGSRQPEPYFDRKMKIYHVPLRPGTRSPFRSADELWEAPEKEKEGKEKKEEVRVEIDVDGIARRIQEIPVSPGNYDDLKVNDKALYFTTRETGAEGKTHLTVLAIDDDPKLKTMVEDIRGFDMSADGKQVMLQKAGANFYVLPAGTAPVKDLSDAKVDLSDWSFSIDPREDWRQLFTDAWRMERDYFYDPGMHGLDWDAMYHKYLPLVDRVTTRSELSDLIGRFVGELSALHTSVRGGDTRDGNDKVAVASLGARFSRDEAAGGYRIDYIYRADPDFPDERSPLDQPGLEVNAGDVITHVNGVGALTAPDLGALLRKQAGEQLRIGVKSAGSATESDHIVVPIGSGYSLRYRDWEYGRRQRVEEQGAEQIGYVHLRAMGSSDLEQWYREFYPVFNRKGLIIDVRHNRGGNIESFILEKLLRQAWMYWKSRDRAPTWNMQYAFRGHLVVLVDERTASDGEAFADGFRRLNLGKVIGTRTWGGEIWLSSSNRLSDNGLARAPMNGVYGPEGEWLIEQRGVEPDIVVDNLPHATFNGEDAQLDAAIRHLLDLIEEDPREVPAPPPFPDRSFEKEK